ncbi:MAG TPA: ATP-binding cassette domain-containing protein [Lentimicrobium sp.]|nr:ATP-binding cassette domain-containing protein [Lentimicrobium sp.]
MVSINLDKVGKQYNSDWIFADISCNLSPKNPTVIIGANGSGKSTLLQIILSSSTPTLGKIEYFKDEKPVFAENAFKLMAISAPYIELIEEFTLSEMISFHGSLKPFVNKLTNSQIIDICRLQKSSGKFIRNFSSGMKQRVKLVLAILSDVPVILLDEPTSNLDQSGIDWYNELVANYRSDRTIVVSSNSVAHEYSFCTQQINLEDYKHIPQTDPSLLLF